MDLRHTTIVNFYGILGNNFNSSIRIDILYKNVYSKRSHAFPPNSNINIYHNQPFGFSL